MKEIHKQLLNNSSYKKLLEDNRFKVFYEILMKDFSNNISFDEKTINILVHLYEYFKKGNTSKLRILNNNSSIIPNSTIIQIHSNDISFITNSIREYLNEARYKTKLIIDLMFTTYRNEQSELLNLKSGIKGINQESLIHIEIHKINNSEQNILEKNLIHILNSVKNAVSDYEPMLQNIKKLNDLFKKGPENMPAQKGFSLYDVINFIHWLLEDNFIFLGYRTYEIEKNKNTKSIKTLTNMDLGIFKTNKHPLDIKPFSIEDHPEKINDKFCTKTALLIDKTSSHSVVHRRMQMDYIEIREFDNELNPIKWHRFLGLFTRKAIFEQAKNIPLLKVKLDRLLESKKIIHGSAMHREIRGVFNTVPKEVLFFSSLDELDALIQLIVQAYREQKVKLFFRTNLSGGAFSIVIAMPEKSMNSNNLNELKQYFQTILKAQSIQYYQARSHPGFWQVYYFLSFEDIKKIPQFSMINLENNTIRILKDWEENLIDCLENKLSRKKIENYLKHYVYNFPTEYKSRNSVEMAVEDMIFFDLFYKTGKSQYNFLHHDLGNNRNTDYTILRIYSKNKMSLTGIMPILENLGLQVIDESAYKIYTKLFTIYLQVFSVTDLKGNRIEHDICENFLENAISKILDKTIANGALNALITNEGLHYSKINLLRSYYNYYFQIERIFARKTVWNILIKHSKIMNLLYQLFEWKFKGNYSITERNKQIKFISEKINQQIKIVNDINEDRILKAFYNLIDSTVRTNFFSKEKNEQSPIAIKIKSKNILNMPEPKPLYEIYVYSSTMQGIHLRGGLIARGGIRFSDRIDDYRTEILALMKTQMTKNSVIVPTGSKGGFIINSEIKPSPEILKTQYQLFISSLLDVTDNIINGQIKHPDGVICYDEKDPYLVVAADKGTAHLSDAANEISETYNFWLGDAFASGGSNGYDHKKEGITAKGAWECVKRHFRELEKDIQTEEFSVIGIGDMSGDVFGNGMLLSSKIILKAAFNHIHIFIDPNPKAKESYIERQRLFKLSKSTWLDYNKNLLSKGGGIFERQSKSITLSKEIQTFLQSDKTQMSGTELIKNLLKAKVELLWNGGVGTYVKSTSETHEQVGDKANNQVRINANELKAKVIGEGGNLGFTQLARIEYAYHDGKINTDAIDNSAGVDMSDHEVNLKILFKQLMDNKIIKNISERNRYLADLTKSLNKKIVINNHLQSLAISIDIMRSNLNIDRYKELMNNLSSEKFLDLKSEFMPSKREISSYKTEGRGLLRPQMAILMAYEKTRVYNELLKSDIPDWNYCQCYLLSYFPKEINEKFKEGILKHILKREIISTVLTNHIINSAGVSFFYELKRDSGNNYATITGAYIFVDKVLNIASLRKELYALDLIIPSELKYHKLRLIEKVIRSMIGLNLHFKQYLIPQESVITGLTKDICILLKQWIASLSGENKISYETPLNKLIEHGIPSSLATKLVALEILQNVFIYLPLAKEFNKSLIDCHFIVQEVNRTLKLEIVINLLSKMQPSRMWDQILANHLKVEYNSTVYFLAKTILNKYEGSVQKFYKNQQTKINFFLHLIDHLKQDEWGSFEPFVVILRFLKQIIE